MKTNLEYDYDAVISYCVSSQCTGGFTSLNDDLNALATDLTNVEDAFHCKSGSTNCLYTIYEHFSKILGSTDGVNYNSGSGLGKILTYGAAVVNTCYEEALVDKGILEESSEYCVQSGDTLNAIAARNGTTVEEICAANGITNPNQIAAGQTLTIPGASGTSNSDLANVSLDEGKIGNVGITFGDDAFADDDTDTGVMATDGASVSNGTTSSVQGSLSPGTSATTHSAQSYNLSDEEYKKLSALVYSEAVEGNSYCYSDSMAVASTVLNRVEAGNWGGNTVSGVISASGQFSGYQNSKYNAAINNPGVISAEMKQAIDDTLAGQRNVDTYSFRGKGTYNSFF